MYHTLLPSHIAGQVGDKPHSGAIKHLHPVNIYAFDLLILRLDARLYINKMQIRVNVWK